MVYLPTFGIWLIFKANVGKYISYMDPVGKDVQVCQDFFVHGWKW